LEYDIKNLHHENKKREEGLKEETKSKDSKSPYLIYIKEPKAPVKEETPAKNSRPEQKGKAPQYG